MASLKMLLDGTCIHKALRTVWISRAGTVLLGETMEKRLFCAPSSIML